MARTRRRIPAMKSMMWVKLHFHSCTLVGHVGPVSAGVGPDFSCVGPAPACHLTAVAGSTRIKSGRSKIKLSFQNAARSVCLVASLLLLSSLPRAEFSCLIMIL
jgi:hypothetical protein